MTTKHGASARRTIVLLALAFAVGAVGCHSEQDVRNELEKKENCEIKEIKHQESGSYEYTLHCGDQECTGTMTIEKGLGSSSTSSFETCALRDDACKDDTPQKCAEVGSKYFGSDEKKARTFYDKACGASPEHCKAIGDKYFEAEKPAAIEYYRRTCDKPRKECALIGDKYLKSDEKQARAFYDKGCSADPAACSHAGSKFEEDNTNIAAEYFAKGCTDRHADGYSCFTMGLWLSDGKGVEKDVAKARAKYELGCSEDSAASCNNLGVLYARGEGGNRDNTRALELMGKGCKLGNDKACDSLKNNCDKGMKKACEEQEKAQAAKP